MPIHDIDPQQPDATADSLRVFISYARADASDFAEYVVVALKLSAGLLGAVAFVLERGTPTGARLQADGLHVRLPRL